MNRVPEEQVEAALRNNQPQEIEAPSGMRKRIIGAVETDIDEGPVVLSLPSWLIGTAVTAAAAALVIIGVTSMSSPPAVEQVPEQAVAGGDEGGGLLPNFVTPENNPATDEWAKIRRDFGAIVEVMGEPARRVVDGVSAL